MNSKFNNKINKTFISTHILFINTKIESNKISLV